MSADDAKPPEGIAPDILAAALATPPGETDGDDLGCDAYALWAAMTRLAHEVKLQGRAFAALREVIECRPASDGDAEGTAAMAKETLAALQEQTREAERRIDAMRRHAESVEDELLSTLTDIHDRLARGLAVSRQRAGTAQKGRLRRFLFGSGESRAAESLVESQELALRRVADELARRGLRAIPVLGEQFDRETMRAVATDSSVEAPGGTVTAVIRGGWFKGDAVWRVAEVTVARGKD